MSRRRCVGGKAHRESSERSGSPTPTLGLIVRSSNTLDAESERGMKSEMLKYLTGSRTCVKAVTVGERMSVQIRHLLKKTGIPYRLRKL